MAHRSAWLLLVGALSVGALACSPSPDTTGARPTSDAGPATAAPSGATAASLAGVTIDVRRDPG